MALASWARGVLAVVCASAVAVGCSSSNGSPPFDDDAGADGSVTPDASGPCTTAADCDDALSCTIDTCLQGACSHVPGPNAGATACPGGKLCDAALGCVSGPACATSADCARTWAGDACKTNVRCDAQTSTCTFDVLDKDGDKHPPVVCGGDDCDDSSAAVVPGIPEACNGKDDNCDQATDEGATCPGVAVCQAGACHCDAQNTCGADCVDLQTDEAHCGTCATQCPSGGTCTKGVCACSPNATVCTGACADLQTDPAHCGTCDGSCATGYSCVGGHCACTKTSCGGVCVDTQIDALNCNGCNKKCAAGLACVGGACQCAVGTKSCGGVCIDVQTDEANCGTCGTHCAVGGVCTGGVCGCPSGQKLCSGACIDPLTDPNNCSSCGTKCSGGGCQSGQCVACALTDLSVIVDQSGSMSAAFGPSPGTRYSEMVSAVDTFVGDTKSIGVGFAMQFLGLPVGTTATDSCVASDYTNMEVPMAALPANAGTVVSRLASHSASTGSPPVPALQGVLAYAKTWRQNNPTHKGAVVLITDSLPLVCTTVGVTTDLVAAAQSYLGGNPSVPTYVIQVGADDGPTAYDPVAAAGGTSAAYHPSSGADILAELRAIRASLTGCP